MRRVSSAIVLAVLIAQQAHAGVWDILEQDLKAAEDAQILDTEADAALRTEAAREATATLFPELPLETKGTLELRREQRVGDFVSVENSGKTIVFHDVPLKEWFAPYVRVMAEQGVVNGYQDEHGNPLGLFKPQSNVSVEELAKIVVSLTGGIAPDCPATPRNPTASGSWSLPFVGCAEARNWVVFSDGSINVKRQALRSEVIVTALQAYKQEAATASGTIFNDVPASIQFAASIEKAHADGLVTGYSDSQGNAIGTFGPHDPVTRAELVKILTLAQQVYTKKK